MSFYQGKTVLVTGAAGFIGSHLVDRLLSLEAKVIGIDNFITGNKKNISHLESNPNFTFIQADVIDSPEMYLQTINDELSTINCIFHLASPASPDGYQKHPVETYMVNSIGTHNLLQWMLAHNPKARFLYTSTSEVYGDPLEHPQKESYFGNVNPNGPRSMYDESKRLGEAICAVHTRSFAIDTRVVRIFNTYGPRMDLHDGRVIPDFIKSILHNAPITLHGDGEQTRSFCYVSDLVSGVLRLMEEDKARGETVNIGNPVEISMRTLANKLLSLTQSHSPLATVPSREDDPKQRCPDISKAKELLSWEPLVDLDKGLQETYEYFKTKA